MTVTMTSKRQITIPKDITDAFGFDKGSIFDVRISRNHIELVPVVVEVKKFRFNKQELEKLKKFRQEGRKKAKKVTQSFIDNIRKGKI